MTTRMAALDATDNIVIRSSRCRIRFDSPRQARTGTGCREHLFLTSCIVDGP